MVEVVLRPMTAEEFATYLPWAKGDYTVELMRNTGITEDQARRHADDAFDDLTADGVLTAGHRLLVAEDAASGARVGLLWLTVREDGDVPAMWIYDIFVEEPMRGRGYGRRLLELVEAEAHDAGVDRVELNVAGDNERARSLYGRVGYREMHRQMYKSLAAAGRVEVRPLDELDGGWAAEQLTASWGATSSVSRGRLYDASALPGFVALVDGERAGLLTYAIDDAQCEVVTLDAFMAGHGVGSALLGAATDMARQADMDRLWLITTNDNVEALRFYQRQGMRLVAVYVGAVEASRRLKPSIPAIGRHGIPIHDELELEIRLGEPATT
jgi:ribosomal protein S18 acetylase RimI-like enzyme